MANGDIASAEPNLWTIHEGKLYFKLQSPDQYMLECGHA
jgi:hypothetical protein